MKNLQKVSGIEKKVPKISLLAFLPKEILSQNTNSEVCEFWGFHSDVIKYSGLLGCNTASHPWRLETSLMHKGYPSLDFSSILLQLHHSYNWRNFSQRLHNISNLPLLTNVLCFLSNITKKQHAQHRSQYFYCIIFFPSPHPNIQDKCNYCILKKRLKMLFHIISVFKIPVSKSVFKN
jgi:hypothetical protein